MTKEATQDLNDWWYCPGCDDIVTPTAAGAYRTYCAKCVATIPSLPDSGKGYILEGTRHNFRWLEFKGKKLPNELKPK